jgi:hypothetical protein
MTRASLGCPILLRILTEAIMKAYWTEEMQKAVNSVLELQAVIDDVKRLGEPTMLFLEHKDGRTLVLGLGNPESVLTFIDHDGRSFHSVGDASRRGMLTFWCRDQQDDFMAEMAVPEPLAIAAAESFIAEGTMPPNVTWEADW